MIRYVYMAIAITTLASRLITLASNIDRELKYRKRKKHGMGSRYDTQNYRSSRFNYPEDDEFNDSPFDDFRH